MAVSFTTNEAEVEALYVGYFGRAGDPLGVNYWVGQLNSGAMTYPQIAASFSVQTEATTMYAYLANPNISNSSAFINQVYQELFNRVADASGMTYWQAQLTAGNNSPASIGTFIQNVISGAQGADATAVENKVAVATYFTNDLSTAHLPYNAAANAQGISEVTSTDSTQASVTTQESNANTYVNATSSGQTYTLTTAVDNIVGAPGSDTFNGTYSDGGIGNGNTFQIGDTLAGGGGANNTLIITPNTAIGAGAAATSLVDAIWANITGIENVLVTTAAGAINIATGPDFNTAFDATGVNLTATSTAGAISINLSGATFEGLVASVAFTGDATITAISTGAGAQNIATDVFPATVTATAAAGAQTILGADLTTVTATNTGAGAQTIDSTGAGPVTVDANANGGLQTITTGAGNDIITLNSSASLGTINAGPGNNNIILGATHTGVDTIEFVGGTPWIATNTVSPMVDTIVNFRGSLDILAFSTATFGNGSAVGVAATNIDVLANTTTALNMTNADIAGTAGLAALTGHQSIVLVGSNTVGSTVAVYIENAGGTIGNTVTQELAAHEIVLVAHVTIVGVPLTAGDFSSIA